MVAVATPSSFLKVTVPLSAFFASDTAFSPPSQPLPGNPPSNPTALNKPLPKAMT